MRLTLRPRRRLIPSRLFWKIFLSLWLAITALSFCVDFAVDAMFQAELRQSPDLSIGYRAELATTLLATTLRHGSTEAARQLLEEWSGRRELPVLVVNEQGQDLIGRTVPAPALAQALARLENKQKSPAVQRVMRDNGESHVLFVPLLLQPATAPHQHIYRYAESTYVEVITMAMVSLLFAIGLTWYLYRPIRYLHEASQRFASGDLSVRVSDQIGRRRDEIADLGRDFDEMARRLQTTIEEKTRLLHDVSHELRSPLARMQIALELSRQTPGRAGEMWQRIGHEIDRLDKTLGETLTLARLESGANMPHDQCVNIVELLADIVADAQFEAGPGGRQIVFAAEEEILVTGRCEILHSAFENVIRNAVLHTPEGAAVVISLSRPTDNLAMVAVCDCGPGVPDNELVSMFTPFSRGRSDNKAQGYGLGLAIVRHAIEAHGGTVSAANKASGGLCVSLLLPVTTLDRES
ncbi:MAG: two-component sensor histidine kinase [Betaproteobacteria bacterium HGW-Betaproteobacteria-10]|nr:MAG: two-component sensor histidine kinase [Betaproteobacteria bacterium HGW-Betaproteobacteria-10]